MVFTLFYVLLFSKQVANNPCPADGKFFMTESRYFSSNISEQVPEVCFEELQNFDFRGLAINDASNPYSLCQTQMNTVDCELVDQKWFIQGCKLSHPNVFYKDGNVLNKCPKCDNNQDYTSGSAFTSGFFKITLACLIPFIKEAYDLNADCVANKDKNYVCDQCKIFNINNYNFVRGNLLQNSLETDCQGTTLNGVDGWKSMFGCPYPPNSNQKEFDFTQPCVKVLNGLRFKGICKTVKTQKMLVKFLHSLTYVDTLTCTKTYDNTEYARVECFLLTFSPVSTGMSIEPF
ncbi:hypothetical protein MHBO_001526 [Bonamia ostreae]|uniref:Uncharacterized protein n=1 Tax=Bonamia ostreae TaxID=126728 RepID=A0ABV2AJA6_9EUKA